jgi:3',5'-cyclic AMP phosphodiesterase CpdA
MPGRRTLIRTAGAAALFARFGGFTAPALAAGPDSAAPLFKFGVVADPQYAASVPNLRLNRYYSNTLWKLSEAIAAWNKEDLAFVVTLGDIIDHDWESYGHMLPLYDGLKAENFFILGNHDFYVAPEFLTSVLRTTGLKRSYYDFPGGGWRFVVIDTNEAAAYANPVGSPAHALGAARLAAAKAAGAANALPYNGAMSDTQYAWLEATLVRAQAAGERVMVLGHHPVYPLALKDNMLDDARLVETLARHPNVAAYLCGHRHAGKYAARGAQHYVNFCGMVVSPDHTAYAVVEVWPDRIEIRGSGREPSRSLRI